LLLINGGSNVGRDICQLPFLGKAAPDADSLYPARREKFTAPARLARFCWYGDFSAIN
jgi:hypothetical protein